MKSRRCVNSAVMPRYLRQISVLVFAALLSSCGHGVVVDPNRARPFGDFFMDDLINDRRKALYAKMEPEFHNLTTEQEFVNGMDTLYRQVGKPSRFEVAGYGAGFRALNNGQTKPYCEIIYNVTTTNGIYPLTVRIVNNGNALAVTLFTFKLPN
jgi:hypothetical protein